MLMRGRRARAKAANAVVLGLGAIGVSLAFLISLGRAGAALDFFSRMF
jgi:hypothetical protein